MKLSKSFYFILIGLIACTGGENKSGAKENKQQENPQPAVHKTPAHVRVPNSKLFIIPPVGFFPDTLSGQLTKEYEGYVPSFGVMIMSSNMVTDYFTSIKQDSESKNPGVWKEEQTNAGGHEVIIYRFPVGPDVRGYQLRFTDGSTDQMIMAFYPAKDTALEKEMYKALKTVVIDE
jgi:hypothetical protein